MWFTGKSPRCNPRYDLPSVVICERLKSTSVALTIDYISFVVCAIEQIHEYA